jgi:hypothetical protein
MACGLLDGRSGRDELPLVRDRKRTTSNRKQRRSQQAFGGEPLWRVTKDLAYFFPCEEGRNIGLNKRLPRNYPARCFVQRSAGIIYFTCPALGSARRVYRPSGTLSVSKRIPSAKGLRLFGSLAPPIFAFRTSGSSSPTVLPRRRNRTWRGCLVPRAPRDRSALRA